MENSYEEAGEVEEVVTEEFPPRRPLPLKRYIIIGGLLLLLMVLAWVGKSIYVDWLWFESLGFSSVFITILTTKIVLFIIGAVLFFILYMVSTTLARRFSPTLIDIILLGKVAIPRQMVSLGIIVIGILLSLFFGWYAQHEQWNTVLKFLNAQPFGSLDPILNTEVSFYIFNLPLYRFAQMWMLPCLVVISLITAGIYALNYSLQGVQVTTAPAFRKHLSILGAGIVLLFTWGYWLDIFAMMYSKRGVVYGLSYTDDMAQLLAFRLLIAVTIICALILLVNVFLGSSRLPALALGVWVIVLILASGIYPVIVQRFQVEPNELARETRYLEHNIAFTRDAFALDRIESQPFLAEEAPSLEDIQANPGTITNIRLWDHRPLLDTYNQKQAIRLYYEFHDVDVDRYTIDGTYRQVMLAARELPIEKLDPEAQTWVNQRLVYTHGYGVTMSPVNEKTTEGLPVLLLKDIPTVGVIDTDRPEVYYGEKSTSYVIVNTNTPEFDYPKGDENIYCQYEGDGGVSLDSYLKKLVYAWEFGDVNIIISGELTSQSRILYYRNIEERVHYVAPFLVLDSDPYPVIVDGRLVWVQDAYTVSDKYPYSEPYRGEITGLRNNNYVRNSVKVVIDAYDGSLKFYIADPTDPIVNTYVAIFPELFTSMEEMPQSLKEHIRYPMDFFLVQAEMYKRYHMQDVKVYYGNEDLWTTPREVYAGKEQPVEPYYIIMRLPGQAKEEFLLMLPLTPTGKDNIISWMAARCDGDQYGKLLVYEFPKDKLIYGPMQVESRIVQDPTISEQFTLWDLGGSRVIRGNLLVIPIGESNLYVEPVFLQAAVSKFPELKRVIVVSGEQVAMEETLDEALTAVFGSPTGPTPLPTDISALVEQALQYYVDMEQARLTGDWAGFGEALEALEAVLQQIEELTSE